MISKCHLDDLKYRIIQRKKELSTETVELNTFSKYCQDIKYIICKSILQTFAILYEY